MDVAMQRSQTVLLVTAEHTIFPLALYHRMTRSLTAPIALDTTHRCGRS